MNQILLSLTALVLLSVSSLPAMAKHYTPAQCPVVGNTTSKVYHTSTSGHYAKMLDENVGTDNRQCFQTVAAAEKAGFKKTALGVTAVNTKKTTKKVVVATKKEVKETPKKASTETRKTMVKKIEKTAEKKETKLVEAVKKDKLTATKKKKSTSTMKKSEQ